MLMSVSVSAAVLAAITSIAFAAVLPLGLTQPTPRIAAQTKVYNDARDGIQVNGQEVNPGKYIVYRGSGRLTCKNDDSTESQTLTWQPDLPEVHYGQDGCLVYPNEQGGWSSAGTNGQPLCCGRRPIKVGSNPEWPESNSDFDLSSLDSNMEYDK